MLAVQNKIFISSVDVTYCLGTHYEFSRLSILERIIKIQEQDYLCTLNFVE